MGSPSYAIQQDNYADYAESLTPAGLENLSAEDTRLFPGYPLLIKAIYPLTRDYVLAGIAVSVLGSVVASAIFYVIFEDLAAAVIWSMFPPVWVELGSKVANEALFMVFTLYSLHLTASKKWTAAGFFAGISLTIRLIASMLILSQLILHRKSASTLKQYIRGLLPGIMILPLYNWYVFGFDNIFYQLSANSQFAARANGLTLGFWQLPQDIVRAISWGQWRIASVGTIYIVFVSWGTYLLRRYRNRIKLGQLIWLWHLGNLAFVLSLAPIPILEEFPRYMAPSYPLIILAYLAWLRDTDGKGAILQRWLPIRYFSRAKATLN